MAARLRAYVDGPRVAAVLRQQGNRIVVRRLPATRAVARRPVEAGIARRGCSTSGAVIASLTAHTQLSAGSMPTPETSRQPGTALSFLRARCERRYRRRKVWRCALYTVGCPFGGSVPLLADAEDEALLLLGRKQAKARPSARHPLGEGRATYFWSFVVAVLFTLGGVFHPRRIHRLKTPADIDEPWVGVAIVVFAMLAEGVAAGGRRIARRATAEPCGGGFVTPVTAS